MEISQSWNKDTIKYDKSIGRNDGLYPDTVLWGIAVNGIMNPTLLTFLQELAKEVEEKHDKKETK